LQLINQCALEERYQAIYVEECRWTEYLFIWMADDCSEQWMYVSENLTEYYYYYYSYY